MNITTFAVDNRNPLVVSDMRRADRETDRQTERQTDRRKILDNHPVSCMQSIQRTHRDLQVRQNKTLDVRTN